VEKAKKLVWSRNPYTPNRYGTWGSKDEDYGTKYYNVELSHGQEMVVTPDGKKKLTVLQVSCKKDTGSGIPCNCPGNERHTVCYHGMGALYESFKKSEKLISFFETYESALQRRFSGKIVKVKSLQGSGFLWAVVKDWPKSKVLSVEVNINLMRGEDEGID
jgi:hypothetical protein